MKYWKHVAHQLVCEVIIFSPPNTKVALLQQNETQTTLKHEATLAFATTKLAILFYKINCC